MSSIAIDTEALEASSSTTSTNVYYTGLQRGTSVEDISSTEDATSIATPTSDVIYIYSSLEEDTTALTTDIQSTSAVESSDLSSITSDTSSIADASASEKTSDSSSAQAGSSTIDSSSSSGSGRNYNIPSENGCRKFKLLLSGIVGLSIVL
ncbi:hypothetical protein PACTADRAFT_48059, partial [Pachysolen tannophilus NRRL Y-2460]